MIQALYRGKLVEVMQWCNDWFSIELDGRPKIVSPSTLLFDYDTHQLVLKHKNNGIMLKIFEPVTNVKRGVGEYLFTFKRRKLWT